MTSSSPSNEKIQELKKKILQPDYIDRAIQEIASLLTESINRGQFLLHERK